MNKLPAMFKSPQRTIGYVRLIACAILLGALSAAKAQAIEDQSLPRSAVKTFHVKCNGGWLVMIRYDTRTDPVNICASVQDGSKPQRCEKVGYAQVNEEIKLMARLSCG